MPTYDYVCKHCGVHEERFRTMSKRNKLAVCTECHHNMERVMSVPQPFVFRAPRDIRPYSLSHFLSLHHSALAPFRKLIVHIMHPSG